MTTPREEYIAALSRAYELIDEIKAEETKASEARAIHNRLINELDSTVIEQSVTQEIAAKEEQLRPSLEVALDKAQAALDAATLRFNKTKEAAEAAFNERLEEYTQERKAYLIAIKTDHETQLAEAEMAVHAAKQRAQSATNTYNRHCENFKAQKGPDLKSLIDSLKE